MKFTRRQFMRMSGLGAAAAILPTVISSPGARASERPADQKYLFVMGAFGGASIIDSFMPLPVSLVEAGVDPNRLVAYPDAVVAQPNGSNIRCVAPLGTDGLFNGAYELQDFLTRHYQNMSVLPVQNSSVNHQVAQKRSITGDGIDSGRTIMEAMAERHGEGMPLPNCNMAVGGFVEPGDAEIDGRYRAEIVANPALFAASTHGFEGLARVPDTALIERARGVREDLESLSHFGQTFQLDARRRRYLELRRNVLPQMESTELISKLLFLEDSPELPLEQFGFRPLPGEERERLLDKLPRALVDPLESQAALAYLLVRHNVSCAVTIGLSAQPTFLERIYGTPLAFDYSHTDHVSAQHIMWGRTLKVLNGLIDLLEEDQYSDDPDDGTIWDRSMIYIATDFGRDKTRPPTATFGTGHDLNNGSVLISPMVQGNKVWGTSTAGPRTPSGSTAPARWRPSRKATSTRRSRTPWTFSSPSVGTWRSFCEGGLSSSFFH